MTRNGSRKHGSKKTLASTSAGVKDTTDPPAELMPGLKAADGFVGELLNLTTKEDILAIYEVAYRDKLDLARQQGQALNRALDAQLQKQGALLQAIEPKIRKTVDVKAAEKLAKAITEAGFSAHAIVEVRPGQRDDKERVFTFTIVIGHKKEMAEAVRRGYGDGAILTQDVVVKFDAEAIGILKEIERLRARQAETQQYLLDIKQRTADISSQLLRARANMAKVSLQRDPQGMALLAALGDVQLPQLSTG